MIMSESTAQKSHRTNLKHSLVLVNADSAKLSLLQWPHFQMGISIKDRILHSFVLCSCKKNKKINTFFPAYIPKDVRFGALLR